jgi:hypothetical protein
MAESGCLEYVDRGADNPTSYYKTIMKPVNGGQGPVWVVAPLIIIMFHLHIFTNFFEVIIFTPPKLIPTSNVQPSD